MKLTQNLRVKTVFSTALFLCVFAQRIFGGNLESSAIQTIKISTDLAVRAIIGEAAGEPFVTKLAIAGALRNRGSLDCVRAGRGLNRRRMICHGAGRISSP